MGLSQRCSNVLASTFTLTASTSPRLSRVSVNCVCREGDCAGDEDQGNEAKRGCVN